MPIKQYVNLDPEKPDQLKGLDKKRAGKKVAFKAKLNVAEEGVPIVFEITVGPKNVSTSLEEKNFTWDEMKALSKTAAPGLGYPGSLKRRLLTDANGEATIPIILSECGGDEFTVKAYLPSRDGNGQELKSETYVVWRRLYYQVSRFKGGPKGKGRKGAFAEVPAFDWSLVLEEYKANNHNVELVEDSKTPLIKRYWNTEWDAATLFKSAGDGYDASKEPVTIRAVLVNELSDAGEHEITFPYVKEGEDIYQTIEDPLFFDESKDSGKDFLISAKWRFTDESVSDEREIENIYVEAVYPYKIKINFSKIPKRHSFDFWRKAFVRLRVRTLTGCTNGLSSENSIWIADAYMYNRKRSDIDKQITTIHEVGHFVGMVRKQISRYEEMGHMGKHCNTGLSEMQIQLDSYKGLPGTCVMFGEDNALQDGHFCELCSRSIRIHPVKNKIMPTSW